MKLLSLSGNARCGKDSTFNILSKYLPVKRVAFADELKRAVDPLCRDLFGISSFTSNSNEKEIIRNILVCVGNTARSLNENVWVDKVRPIINNVLCDGHIPVITDCRFLNECFFIQDELKGTIVHLDRVLSDGSILQPANPSEAENYPKLLSRANIHIIASNLEELENEVKTKVLPMFNIEKLHEYPSARNG